MVLRHNYKNYKRSQTQSFAKRRKPMDISLTPTHKEHPQISKLDGGASTLRKFWLWSPFFEFKIATLALPEGNSIYLRRYFLYLAGCWQNHDAAYTSTLPLPLRPDVSLLQSWAFLLSPATSCNKTIPSPLGYRLYHDRSCPSAWPTTRSDHSSSNVLPQHESSAYSAFWEYAKRCGCRLRSAGDLRMMIILQRHTFATWCVAAPGRAATLFFSDHQRLLISP